MIVNMRGFSLIEVLVALLVLSIGLLGIASMQLVALRSTRSAYLNSVATIQVNAMLERLRASRSVVGRQKEFRDWEKENKALLPDAKGEYQCSGSDCRVSLHWHDRKSRSLAMKAKI